MFVKLYLVDLVISSTFQFHTPEPSNIAHNMKFPLSLTKRTFQKWKHVWQVEWSLENMFASGMISIETCLQVEWSLYLLKALRNISPKIIGSIERPACNKKVWPYGSYEMMIVTVVFGSCYKRVPRRKHARFRPTANKLCHCSSACVQNQGDCPSLIARCRFNWVKPYKWVVTNICPKCLHYSSPLANSSIERPRFPNLLEAIMGEQ